MHEKHKAFLIRKAISTTKKLQYLPQSGIDIKSSDFFYSLLKMHMVKRNALSRLMFKGTFFVKIRIHNQHFLVFLECLEQRQTRIVYHFRFEKFKETDDS